MKRAIILGSALSVLGLMLVSCASEPSATSTTTRQTTVTTPGTPVHAPGGLVSTGKGTENPGY